MGATFDLSKVAGGALQRKVNQAFAQVVENMCDPNTVPDKKREINIKVQFVQDSYGGQCNCQVKNSILLIPMQRKVIDELEGRRERRSRCI